MSAGSAILHLFDWRFDDVRRELPAIAAAGFGVVQISPPQKSIDTHDWWGRYQPIDHTRLEGPLGSEQDLRELLAVAHACRPRVSVIVDVVLNHMAESCAQRATLRYPRFGPEHFHAQAPIDWNSIESIRTGWVGYGPDLPDLRTELPYVRAEARRYLLKLLDCGVDGFRLDAVKHIEPDFFAEVLAGLPAGLLVYGEYVLQPGHGPVLHEYLPWMRLMDFEGLQRMAATLVPGGDMRRLVEPGAAADGVLLPHQSIAFVTNHDLELGEYGGFGLPKAALPLAHAFTLCRPGVVPLVWKEHRHDPVVVAALRLRQIEQPHKLKVVIAQPRLLAWRLGEVGLVILNGHDHAVELPLGASGMHCDKATELVRGADLAGMLTVPPMAPALVLAAGEDVTRGSARKEWR
jgi:alpha-amylase